MQGEDFMWVKHWLRPVGVEQVSEWDGRGTWDEANHGAHSPQCPNGVGVTISHQPIEQIPNGHIRPSQKNPQYPKGVGVTIGHQLIEHIPMATLGPPRKALSTHNDPVQKQSVREPS